jgi:SAM-dependent methyltransferase
MADGFDRAGIFNDDYLYFAAERLSEAATRDEVAHLCAVSGLQPGERVLDLACGHGRIANRLATLGAQVTGLDATAEFLRLARAEAAELGVTVDYVEGDMRRLPWQAEFDLVVSWFTSFGYFGDQDNRRILAQAHQVLRPGGRVVIELNNRDDLMRRFLPSVVGERDGDLMIDQHAFDPLTGRSNVTRTVIRDGQVRTSHYFTRLFSFTELRDWLEAAGFTNVAGYGTEGNPLAAHSPRMIVTATR